MTKEYREYLPERMPFKVSENTESRTAYNAAIQDMEAKLPDLIAAVRKEERGNIKNYIEPFWSPDSWGVDYIYRNVLTEALATPLNYERCGFRGGDM